MASVCLPFFLQNNCVVQILPIFAMIAVVATISATAIAVIVSATADIAMISAMTVAVIISAAAIAVIIFVAATSARRAVLHTLVVKSEVVNPTAAAVAMHENHTAYSWRTYSWAFLYYGLNGIAVSDNRRSS